MKTLTVYCDKDLVLRWNEWPEEPDEVDGAGDFEGKWHEAAIELAKKDSKPFINQNYIRRIIGDFIDPHNKPIFKKETFYSFPFDGNAKIEGDIARLIQSQPEESQEESQEELWTDLFRYMNLHGNLARPEDHFTLTRKHP